MNDNHHITAKLNELRPILSDGERTLLWQRIAPQIGAAVPSAYGVRLHRKGVVAVMIVLVTLTASGTVAAAQPARPGDVLFPVDQASERALLFVTPKAGREALKERFMEERFYELESLFDDAIISADDSVLAWNNDGELKVEVDIFRDITVVKIELNDQTRYFTTSATEREVVAEAAAARYGLPYEAVLSVMEFSIEDRTSRPRDRGMLAPSRQGGIASAVAVVLDEMERHDDGKREAFAARFMEEYGPLTPFVNDVRIMRYRERIDDGNDDEYEVRSDDSRIEIDDDRIEIRNDAFRARSGDDETVEIKEDDDNDEDEKDFDNDSQEENNDRNHSDSDSRDSDNRKEDESDNEDTSKDRDDNGDNRDGDGADGDDDREESN